jgi:hypothetical protein
LSSFEGSDFVDRLLCLHLVAPHPATARKGTELVDGNLLIFDPLDREC